VQIQIRTEKPEDQAPATPLEEQMRVILDADPGNGFPGSDIDDGLALGLILSSPRFKLEALTIVGGNTAVEMGVRSGLAMLEAAGAEVPVYAGSTRPILEDCAPWRQTLDGFGKAPEVAAMWADIAPPQPKGAARPERAADAIVRIVNDAPGEITIIAVGPLTNVAQAILLDPMLPQKVKRIAIMGGGFARWHTLQEMNFGYDPEAARIVVTSGADILLIPLDATMKTYLTLEENARLKSALKPLPRLLGETCDPWIRYVGAMNNRVGCPLHDPLVVASLLDPSLVTIEKMHVDVELAGHLTRGRSVSWQPHRTALTGGKPLHTLKPIDVAVDVDNEAFVKMLIEQLLA